MRKPRERKQSRRVMGAWTALRLLATAVLFTSAGRVFAEPIEPGDAQQIASVDGVELPVFTYRPDGCDPRLLLLVFHGVGRNGGPTAITHGRSPTASARSWLRRSSIANGFRVRRISTAA